MENPLTDGRKVNKWLNFLSNISERSKDWGPLMRNTTTLQRQAETVQLIMQAQKKGQKGLIIADDVGLGKTWIGILAAITWAMEDRKVLIIAPSAAIQNKWEDELESWLGEKDPNPVIDQLLDNNKFINEFNSYVRNGSKGRKGRIDIVTLDNFFKKEFRKKRDLSLLIVDEAHRFRHRSGSDERFIDFGEHINEKAPNAFRLLLTATPFGKDIEKLTKLLKIAGGNNVDQQLLTDLTNDVTNANEMLLGSMSLDTETFEATIRKLRKWMIRHTIDTLPLSERRSLGEARHVLGKLIAPSDADDDNRREIIGEPIRIDNPDIKRIILHAERLRKLLSDKKDEQPKISKELGGAVTHTAPYSIWGLEKRVKSLSEVPDSAIGYHVREITNLCNRISQIGPMEQALKKFAVTCFKQCEKFIVFCYHNEVADVVYKVLENAANEVVHEFDICDYKFPTNKSNRLNGVLEEEQSTDEVSILKYFDNYKKSQKEIREAVDKLSANLNGKFSSTSLVAKLSKNNAGKLRLLFNSPFFPMALVATTKDSECFDLHQYCRIVVHYELGYRPETLLQANGRVRRIGSWAGRIKKPILYYYPYLEGTRSEALTKEVLRRVERFGHFMGGVPNMDIEALVRDAANHKKGILEPELPDLDFSNGGFCKALHLP